MLNNLYTFKKNAWHAKLFKWLYGTDPTTTFNTMCPYFWSMVFTILLLPILLCFKLLGKTGSNFLSKLESFKRDRIKARSANMLKLALTAETMSLKDAYQLRHSCFWYDDAYYDVPRELLSIIQDKASEYEKILSKEKYRKETQRENTINEIKTNKYFNFIAYIVTALLAFIFVRGAYKMISYLNSSYSLDYEKLMYIGIFLGIVTSLVFISIILYRFIFSPLFSWLSCKKIKLGKLKILLFPLILLGTGLIMLCDMIYLTYKKACPRVTWKD